MPVEERWSASATPALSDDQQRGLDRYAQRLAYQHATAPRPVETQPVQHAPAGRLPLDATTPYASPILPAPQDEYGYERHPVMQPFALPRGLPGGLGVLIRDDAVAPESDRGRVKKSGNGRRRVLPPGLY